MAKRKVTKPVVSVSDRLKKYLLIVLQALCGVLIGLCFFIYNSSAALSVYKDNEVSVYTPAFHELSVPYLDSENYQTNIEHEVAEVIKYGAIQHVFETDGVYDRDKVIEIGEYVHRFDTGKYDGPKAYYTVGDLVAWGRDKVSHIYRFFSKEEYYEFFPSFKREPIEGEITAIEDGAEVISGSMTLSAGDDKADSFNYASVDAIESSYLTVDGLKLEDIALDMDEYKTLTENLELCVNSIYEEYNDYLEFVRDAGAEATNIRYYISFAEQDRTSVFTNAEAIGLNVADDKITQNFKQYGEYLYICPAKPDFATNMPVDFSYINNLIETYSYAYPSTCKFWIGLDTAFPASDIFSDNRNAFENTVHMMPWIISLGASAVIGFIGLAFIIIFMEKKQYSVKGASEQLGDFDRLPIEISILMFIILVLVLCIGELVLIRNINTDVRIDMGAIVPLSIMLGIDIFIMLLFFYGFSRRVICRNLLEGSFFVALSPYVSKCLRKIYAKFWRFYDSAGVVFRTWSAYILFLLLNIFFGSVIIFGSRKAIALVTVMLFDIIVGAVLFNRSMERKRIIDGIRRINAGEYDYQINDRHMHGDNKEFADAVNNIGHAIKTAVDSNIKDEKMKADLITNVSHDIKTPLTSIINYVDLLKRENIKNDKAAKYISILDEKSQRLKQLTFDLVEASKITSGNIKLDMNRIDFNELLNQAIGEFEERFEERGLSVIKNVKGANMHILADPARMWRVIENLFNNIYKYALENTRVYLDLENVKVDNDMLVIMSLKNISGQKLNIPAEELTERFIRGDVSRSTEGTGLGLSIAKSLTMAQGGTFDIYLDGDLFKITISFNSCTEQISD
ncbi:MAG: hypothetical protein K6E19_06330 [Lachnospiraceae bacterium]|nr:hypothetical protein [Lachnospiraceae bacterium]